jgi:hypothetical protein
MRSKEVVLEEKVKSVGEFFSDITGMQIKEYISFPELSNFSQRESPKANNPYTFRLVLEDGTDSYAINACVNFSTNWDPGKEEWLPETSWSVHFNNELLCEDGHTVISSAYRDDMMNKQYIQTELNHHFSSMIGGPSTEVPFMDFEENTVQSFKEGHNFFSSIYLVLMTHMRERGLQMPPILSKDSQISNLMRSGKVKELTSLLDSAIVWNGSAYEKRNQLHMQKEAQIIKAYAEMRKQEKDPAVLIEDVFPEYDITSIEGGADSFRPYNILVVENQLGSLGQFTDIVKNSLELDGRYKNTRLIKEFNLSWCMRICASGKIDAVIMDWTDPSIEEALWVRPQETNIFFDMMHGNTSGVITFDENGMVVDRPDGTRISGQEELRKMAEELDMRYLWMKQIAQACLEVETVPPPYFIIRSEAQHEDIANIISQKLGNPIK